MRVLFPHSLVFYLCLSIFVPMPKPHLVPINLDNQQSKSSQLVFLLQYCLAISDSLPFPLDFRNRVLSFTRTSVGIFTEMTLNQCRRMHISTISNLLSMKKRCTSIYLNRPPLMYLSIKYLFCFVFTVKVLNIFVTFIPRHLP